MVRNTMLSLGFASLAVLLGGCVSEADRSADLGTGPTDLVSESGHVVVRVSPEEGGAHLGKNLFHVTLSPKDPSGGPGSVTLEEASAFMPAHGHASQPPTIVATSDGYAIEQLVFFMSGRWEVTLNLRDRGTPDKLLFGVDVK